MDRVRLGFVLAAVYNSGILIFSKGLGDDLGAVDPLFSPAGCVAVLLWGAAYLALGWRYDVAPALSLVFCVEKAFYGIRWLDWMSDHGAELGAMRAVDPLTASFFAMYGVGDLVFMVFFGWVAWRWRHNLSRNPPV